MIAALLPVWIGIIFHRFQVIYANRIDHKLRSDFTRADNIEVDRNTNHKVVIALKQLGVDFLENFVYQVSDPSSPTYGKYLSREEVGKLTINQPGLDAVREYLRANDIMEYQETLYGEYVSVTSTLGKWENLFGAEFMPYKHISSEAIYFRSTAYEIPSTLTEHVFAIYNIMELPFLNYENRFQGNYRRTLIEDGDLTSSLFGYITPAALNSFYNIFTNQGNSLTSQTIYSAVGQYFSSDDLAIFQFYFEIPWHPVDLDVNSRDQPSQCNDNPNNCGESNLDLQYIMSIAQNTTTSIM